MNDLAILIPTLGRADKLPALLENIHETTTVSHSVYFIAENHDGDTIAAFNGEKVWRKRNDWLIVGDYGSCASAYNAGFAASDEPFCFLANDDLEFVQGWEYPGLRELHDHPIVGINEGHGRMTCFSMVRRSYIEKHSGVFDKPGTLVHPYDSQYVDTELADYAKARGVWGEAHEGGVIHRHWEWGEADRNHPNYLKAQGTLDKDRRTYEERRPQWENAARS